MNINERFKEIEQILYIKHSQIKKNGLEKILNILEKMGNPHKRIGRVIHITGTNGKGSVAYISSFILKEMGYKVGLFTSPHITGLTERIKINGIDISKEDFVRLYEYVVSFDENLSFFETITLIMLKYFEENNLDFSVIEVGIGGLYDTTNVVNGELCFITSIGYDHIDILGPSLQDIAFQKAGIIKENSICVVGDINGKPFDVIRDFANRVGGKLIKVENMYDIIGVNDNDRMILKDKKNGYLFEFGTIGIHQSMNLSMVITGLSSIGISVSSDMFSRFKDLKIYGRFQIVKKIVDNSLKKIILDGAHNPDALKFFLENVKFFGFTSKNALLIFSMLSTKDYNTSVNVICESNLFKDIFVVPIDNPKRLDPIYIANIFSKDDSIDITVFDSLEMAINLALKRYDNIYITGSFYLVSDALRILEAL